MLRYVPVTLEANGHKVNTVALLDEGSYITLMEDELCHELQLKGAKKPLCLSWTGGQQREENKSREVSLNVSAIGNNKRSYRMQLVRTVKKLDQPEQSINCNKSAANLKFEIPPAVIIQSISTKTNYKDGPLFPHKTA